MRAGTTGTAGAGMEGVGTEGRLQPGVAARRRNTLCNGFASAAMVLLLAQGLNATLTLGTAQAQQATGGAGGPGRNGGGDGGNGGDAGYAGQEGWTPPGGGAGGASGAAGTSASPDGGSGGSGGFGGSSGGGGGGGGGFSGNANEDIASAITAGNGGAGNSGGNGVGGSGGGSGGGAGGDGAISMATSMAVNAKVIGGNGGDGGTGSGGARSGGGGGGGAGIVLQQEGDIKVNADVTGGDGGSAGGNAGGVGGGGGGGAGIILQQGGTLDISATVGGGSGGSGGTIGLGGDGGAGIKAGAVVTVNVTGIGKIQGGSGSGMGSGGAGFDAAFGGSVANAGTITGGDGAAGSTASFPGAAGGTGSGGASGFVPYTPLRSHGGVGVMGANLTIDNSGTIAGGTSYFGQASAIVFTGGENFLASSGVITGGVEVHGGSFAPALASSVIGTALDIGAAPLTFSSGTGYNIRVSPTASDSVTTSGTATLTGATVNAAFSPGTYVFKQYTILTAGSLSGVFDGLSSNAPVGSVSLSYDPNNVFLDVQIGFKVPLVYTALNGNQRYVADALSGYFDGTGSIPGAFFSLNPRGLSQASGEVATTAAQAAFDAQSQFLNILTDPFTSQQQDAAETASARPQALSYVAAREDAPHNAFAAMTLKAPSMQSFEQRWRVFGAAYGGNAQIGGNALLGSHDATSRVYGMMGGASYALSPATRLGFAFGGGGTSFGLSDGLGSGRSDLFQAGMFARHGFAQGAYLSGALAYGWHDVRTDRVVPTGELLRGDYKADVFSGRIETGWRIATPLAGVTPYAAGQAISYRMPNYFEQGNNTADSFALGYASRTLTAARSELGFRLDRTMLLGATAVTLRSRAAWVHNFDTNRLAAATFLSLPGTGFIVKGAATAPDVALVSAGAEVWWRNGFALAATFEGEFSNNVHSYAGKGSIRYQW